MFSHKSVAWYLIKRLTTEEVFKAVDALQILDSVEMPVSSLFSCSESVRFQGGGLLFTFSTIPHLHVL